MQCFNVFGWHFGLTTASGVSPIGIWDPSSRMCTVWGIHEKESSVKDHVFNTMALSKNTETSYIFICKHLQLRELCPWLPRLQLMCICSRRILSVHTQVCSNVQCSSYEFSVLAGATVKAPHIRAKLCTALYVVHEMKPRAKTVLKVLTAAHKVYCCWRSVIT